TVQETPPFGLASDWPNVSASVRCLFEAETRFIYEVHFDSRADNGAWRPFATILSDCRTNQQPKEYETPLLNVFPGTSLNEGSHRFDFRVTLKAFDPAQMRSTTIERKGEARSFQGPGGPMPTYGATPLFTEVRSAGNFIVQPLDKI